MSQRDTMRDPRYSGILHAIESKLHEADRLATTRRLVLTDSNIRSLLVRAVNEAKGKVAKSAETAASGKDRFLTETQQQLAAVRAAIVAESDRPDGSVQRAPLPTADWIAALEAIKDSCSIRTTSEPGSRGYLEFLWGFLDRAGVSMTGARHPKAVRSQNGAGMDMRL